MPSPTFQTLTSLFLETVFVGVSALLLFRYRNRLSLAPLFIFVGTNQFLGALLASSIYLVIGDNIVMSPGSTVLFASYLFVILLVYLRCDISTTRGLIYGIVVANVTLTILLWFTSSQMQNLESQNLLGIPLEVFSTSPRFFLFGTVMLLLDSLLVVMIYEYLTVRAIWLPFISRLVLALVIALMVDALAFSLVIAGGEPYFSDILKGQLTGKSLSGLLYGLILYLYLRLFEHQLPKWRSLEAGDIFSIFTHRERYHHVKKELDVAEAANLAKSRFLTNVSHELRTPLNAIIGFTTVLVKRSKEDDEDRLFLTRILANSRHLLALINGLLDLSKIEAGKMELHMSQIDVRDILNETVDQLQGEAVLKSLKLNVEVPQEVETVEMDPKLFKQILINLVGNALKFTPEGTIVARLSTHPGTGKPERLDITDTGIGISEDHLESVFQPFYQEHSQSEIESTGLGLAISRALCTQMGLKLVAARNGGSGSKFSILF